MEGDWRGWCTLNKRQANKKQGTQGKLEQFMLPLYLCSDTVITGVTLWTVEHCPVNG